VTVNVLVAYTARAKTYMTAGGATVAQIVDRDIAIVNRGMVNSAVPMVLKRVGLTAVSSTYNENLGGDAAQPLYDVSYGTNANFPAIRTARNTLKADLVALYIRQQPIHYCGVAWLNVPTPQAAWAFGAVDSYCYGTVTLAHELGHTMGLYHDRYVHPAAPASVYNYGYVSTAGNFRDIMSYSNKCYAVLGHDCPVSTYYSSPLKVINGKPAGIKQGVAGAEGPGGGLPLRRRPAGLRFAPGAPRRPGIQRNFARSRRAPWRA
jgi:hypothetical protein